MKKYFLLIAVLISVVSVKAQQITTLEYFYDTDPGIGNGIAITLSNATLDSTFQFNINGLTPGMHSVGFRMKNSNNKWGSTTWNSFNLFAGTSGTSQIKQIEYFWNNDVGVGQNTIIPTALASNIDTTISIPYPTGGTGTKWLGVRLANQNGYVGNVAYDSVSSCLLATATAGFYIVQSDNTFSCVDTSTYFNGQRSVKWYLNNVLQSQSINSNVFNYDANGALPGTLLIKQVSGFGCQTDSVIKAISVTGFNKISPTHADSTQNATIYISGGGFDSTNMSIEIVPVNDGNRPYLNGGQSANGEPIFLPTFKKVYGNKSYVEVKFKIPSAQMPADTERKLYGIRVRVNGRYLSTDNTGLNFSPEAIFTVYGKKYWVDNSDKHYSYVNPGSLVVFISPAYYHKWADLPNQPFYVDKKNGVINRGQGGANSFSVDITGPKTVRLNQTVIKTIEISNNGNEVANDVPVYISMPYNNVKSEYMVTQYWQDPTICTTTSIQCEYPVSDDRDANADTDPGADEIAYPDDDFPTPNDFIEPSDNTLRTHVRQDLKTYPAIDRMPDGTLYLHDRFDVTGFIIPKILPGQTYKIPVKVKPGPRKQGDTKRDLPIQATVTDPITLPDESMNTGSSSVFDCVNEFLKLKDNYELTHPDYTRAWHDYQNQKRMYYDKTATYGQEIQSMQFLLKRALFPNSPLAIIYRKRLKEREAILAMYESRWKDQLKLKKQAFDALKEKCKDNERFLPIIFNDNTNAGLPFDPNYITGNSQYDNNKNWINGRGAQHYTIGFENLPAAAANAQHVFIIDTLNKFKFGLETLILASFRIGDTVYNVTPFSKQTQRLVGIKGRNDMKVNFSARLDTATSTLRFDFYSMVADGSKTIDPASLDGFLPPNSTDGLSGTGSVSFDIYTSFMGTDSTFTNKAHIYFDKNPAIVTNTWLNTVDTTSPTGKIVSSYVVNDSTVGLVLQHNDAGSGYANANLYGKLNTENDFYYIGKLWGDTLQVLAKPGQTWQYYIEAVDNVGNVGKKSAIAEVTHTFQSGSSSSSLVVYPIPTTDFIKVFANESLQGIDIVDMAGRKVRNYAVSTDNKYVVYGLPSGVYVVRGFKNNGGVLTKKIVIVTK